MPVVNADVLWAVEDVRRRLPNLELFRRYDEGDHSLTFATDKFRNAFGNLFREFADNLCDDVVNGVTDRLQIIGWSAADSNDTELATTVDRIWERNQGEARSGAVHRHAFRDGDGFSIVQQAADGTARTWKQDPRLMAIRYSQDNPDDVDLMGKVWRQGNRYRLNLYQPDGTVERWASGGLGAGNGLPQAGAFKQLAEGDPLLAGAVPVEKGSQIPGFHYPNGDLSCYGRSILIPVIPLQDALNKSVADMLVAMEFHAYPQRWATGVQTERDATGKTIDPFAAGEGRVWYTSKEGGNFGQFEAAQMDGFLNVQRAFRLEIGRKGYLTPTDLTGDAQGLSGVALLVVEGRAVKLAKDRIRDWSPERRREMAYACTLELGRPVLPEELEVNWAPPETRDMKALLEELALKKDLGVPTEQILEEMGYAPDKVQEFLDEADAEGEAAQIAAAALTGGRQRVTVGAAGTQAQALGLPSTVPPPAGGATPLAS